MLAIRKAGSNARGGSFDTSTVQAVWNKGLIVPGFDAAQLRKDRCGAFIRRSDYGTTGPHGWEIDHIRPVAHGGGDELENLQPLQWQNNRHKGDDYPGWTCAVRAAA